MGVTRFQSQVDVGSSGGADVDKLASSFEKLAGAIEGASGKSDKLAEHPGFEAFAEKVRSGIENPMQAAGAAAEGALKALGPMGTAVSAGVGIFTAFGAATFEAAHSLGEYATQIHNVSLRTGLSTREVGQFSFAAKAAGQDVSVFESAMRKLSQGLDENSEEGKKARAGLADLGVSAYDSSGKLRPMSEIFIQISEGLNGIEEPAKRNAEALKIFGRAGIELLPTILGLSENLERARELGLGPKEEDIARWETYHRQIAEAEARWDGLMRKVKEPLASVFTIVFRSATGDMSDIATPAAATLKADIPKIATAEAQRRLEVLAGFLPESTSKEIQAAIQKEQTRRLFTSGTGGFVPDLNINTGGATFASGLTVDTSALAGLGVTVDTSAFERTIRAALAPTGEHSDLRAAQTTLGELQGKLRTAQELKAPYPQLMEAAAAVEQQKQIVAGIEAQIKATKDLAEEEKKREEFLKQLGAEEVRARDAALDPAERILAKMNEQIAAAEKLKYSAEEMLAIRQREGAIADVELETLAKKANLELAAYERTREQAAAKARERRLILEPGLQELGEAGRGFAADVQIEQIERRSRRLSISGGPARNLRGQFRRAPVSLDDVQSVNDVYNEQLQLAAKLYDFDLAEAAKIADKDEERIAKAEALAAVKKEMQAAEIAGERKIEELQQRRLDELRARSGEFFDALLQGQKGIEQFITGIAKGWGRTIFQNFTMEFLQGWSGHFTLPGQGTRSDPTFLGRVLAGTPLGIDPLKGVTEMNTLATIENTAALRALTLSRVGAGGSAGWGFSGMGGGSSSAASTFSRLSGIFTSSGGSSGGGIPDVSSSVSYGSGAGYTSDGVQMYSPENYNEHGVFLGPGATSTHDPSISPIGRTIGDLSPATRALGIGGAALAGGIGIYSGIKSGGARGDLMAAGAAAAMAGNILGLASKALKVAGPIGDIVGMGLGIASMLMPDPKQVRDAAETKTLNEARYTAPTPESYTLDRYGRSYDRDMSGNIRPTIQVNIPVSAIDAKSFLDNSDQIMAAVTQGLEAKASPRLASAIRNVAFQR